MKALEVLFWISLFIVFYTYIGYGILLYILVKIKECFRKPAPRPMPADDALPPLTLFIAAYNEEDVVDEKMHNCLELATWSSARARNRTISLNCLSKQ